MTDTLVDSLEWSKVDTRSPWEVFNPYNDCNEVANKFGMPQMEMHSILIQPYREDGTEDLEQKVKLIIFRDEMSSDHILIQLEEQYNGMWCNLLRSDLSGPLKVLVDEKLQKLELIHSYKPVGDSYNEREEDRKRYSEMVEKMSLEELDKHSEELHRR